MARPNVLAHSGNQVLVKFDGKTIGVISGVELTEDYAHEPLSGIGNIEVQEWVPTLARYTVTSDVMTLRKTSLYSLGIMGVDSQAVLQGLVFDIEVFDIPTGQLLRKYQNCSYVSGRVTVNKHTIVTHNATFNCTKVSGDLTVSA